MPARLAYGLIYTCITARLDGDGKLRLDALLGVPEAETELQRRRHDAVVGADFEVG